MSLGPGPPAVGMHPMGWLAVEDGPTLQLSGKAARETELGQHHLPRGAAGGDKEDLALPVHLHGSRTARQAGHLLDLRAIGPQANEPWVQHLPRGQGPARTPGQSRVEVAIQAPGQVLNGQARGRQPAPQGASLAALHGQERDPLR